MSEETATPSYLAAVLAAIEMVNRNVTALEARLTEMIEDRDARFRSALSEHIVWAERREGDLSTAVKMMGDRLSTYDLAQARKEGRLDVGRWVAAKVTQNYRLLLVLLASLGLAIGKVNVTLGG